MTTQTQPVSVPVIPASHMLLEDPRVLLASATAATWTDDSANLAPVQLSERASQLSSVLRQMLEDRGYFHGGLNE